jgi:hypothetical protein
MKAESGDDQNESAETQWPSVLKIANDEFQQSVAVAQLAVKLCELKRVGLKTELLKEGEIPEKFLAEAWELIEKAREHVVRSQTDAECLQSGTVEAEKVVGRVLLESRIPFQDLCDPDRNNKGDTKIIKLLDAETGKTIEVEWKVFRSERGFDDLFWSYWDATSIIKDEGERKEYGRKVLDSWKTNGVPPNDFLALASGYFDFERGVKVITGENRLDRALPSFRRFLKLRFANEDLAERAMAEYREKGFAPREPYSLKDEFAKWKRKEKSRNAKLSREARRKRADA